jgi:hypothetical protein
MLRASLGKVVHTVQRAGTFAAKVSPQELHKIAVHVRAVGEGVRTGGRTQFGRLAVCILCAALDVGAWYV